MTLPVGARLRAALSIGNARKDLDCYNAMARDAESPDRIAAAVLSTLEHPIATGGTNRLVPQLASILGTAMAMATVER